MQTIDARTISIAYGAPMSLGSRIKAARMNAGYTQAQVAKQFGLKQAAVSQWENDVTDPGADRIARLAALFDVSADYLTLGQGPLNRPAARTDRDREIEEMIPNAAHPARIGGRDLPILGKAQGGPDGVLSFGDQAFDYTARPAALLQVKDAYALWVDGDSMSGFGLPEGTEVHVHPHRPPRPGRFCVVIKTNGDAFVKRYVAHKGGKVVVEQSDPAKTLEFLDREVRAVHRVTGVAYD